MSIPPLTQSVGSAERAMRALLERHLQATELSFADWTILVFTSATPLNLAELAQRQIAGHVVADENAIRQSLQKLVEAGLIAAEGTQFIHTDQGSARFKELGAKIKAITQTLYGDLPVVDLEATHRTLLEIAGRANNMLSSPTP